MPLNGSVCKQADFLNIFEPNQTMCAGPPSDVAVTAVLFAPKSKQILIFNQDLSDLTKSLQNVGFMILKRPVIK